MSHLRHTSQKCSAPHEHFWHAAPSALAGRLGRNGIGVEGATAIAAVLKDSQLSTLGCAAAPTAAQMCSGPAEHSHVARFRRSLRNNRLGDEGWTALFKALCENKGDKIESWDLLGEGVGPQTAKALAEYASVSPALKIVKCARPPCIQARTHALVSAP